MSTPKEFIIRTKIRFGCFASSTWHPCETQHQQKTPTENKHNLCHSLRILDDVTFSKRLKLPLCIIEMLAVFAVDSFELRTNANIACVTIFAAKKKSDGTHTLTVCASVISSAESETDTLHRASFIIVILRFIWYVIQCQNEKGFISVSKSRSSHHSQSFMNYLRSVFIAHNKCK